MRKFFIALLAVALGLGLGIAATPTARAEVNVYTTPGEHTVNGRQWRTWCEPYSQTARCTTQILSGGAWVFNNLTYLPSPRELWAGNPLATPGDHVIAGRNWRVACDTPEVGRNGCRDYIWSGGKYVFNSLVLFGDIWPNLSDLYAYRPPTDPPAISNYSMSKGPNTTNRVLLTFDDCPKSLDAFKATVVGARQAGVALALFPTGNCLKSGKFDLAIARANGHTVFNHSVTHPDLTTLSYSGVLAELGSPGVVTTYGRPPYGAWNSNVKSAYDAKGMRIWTWNLDTKDFEGKTTAQVVNFVVANAKAGNSVLMHMQWNGFTASAISQMKSGLAAKGIEVCRNQGVTTLQKPASIIC
ncbi:polysaccharide deacetylase family protein [Tessaracoccus sp. G1721]